MTKDERRTAIARRQREFKAKQAELGLVQVNVWVPRECMAEIIRAAELMRAEPHLQVARLVDTKTGKLRGLKANPAPRVTMPSEGE